MNRRCFVKSVLGMLASFGPLASAGLFHRGGVVRRPVQLAGGCVVGMDYSQGPSEWKSGVVVYRNGPMDILEVDRLTGEWRKA